MERRKRESFLFANACLLIFILCSTRCIWLKPPFVLSLFPSFRYITANVSDQSGDSPTTVPAPGQPRIVLDSPSVGKERDVFPEGQCNLGITYASWGPGQAEFSQLTGIAKENRR